ncbi:MAG: ATP-binding protein [Thermodesulfobacteriota bacterium]|nr:ATP-binding protein [Thermodesulfobacteriota bacterium]
MTISVRKRITIAFTVLILLGGVNWLINDYRNHVLHLKFNIITEKNRLLNTTLEARRYEKNYFLYYNEKDLIEAISYAGEAEEQLSEIVRNYKGHTSSQNLTSYRQELERYKNSLVTLHNQNKEDSLARLDVELAKPQKQKQATIRMLGQKITSDLELMVQKEQLTVNRIVKESRIFSLIGALIVFLLFICVAFFFIFRINRPLRKIARAVRKIAAGDYEKIPPLNTHDEFEAFVASLNTMISEVNKRNEQLIQSRKMASLGTLTSGVAHELNNPLNNISTSLQIVIEELEGGDPAFNRDLLLDAETQVERTRDIVRALLEFSRERNVKPRKASVKRLVQESIKLIKGELPGSIELRIEVPDDVQTVMDFRRMQQVFINLILNAVHAMKGGGVLTIRAYTDQEAGHICLEVQDTGNGIPARDRDKIFDPFFTTKEVGQGTGLGLSVSHGIIKSHGGKIEVESEEGKGTTFYICLPIREEGESVENGIVDAPGNAAEGRPANG